MAENVILSVQLTGAEAAITQLTQIDSLITRLKANRNVKINVSASGLTSAANQAEKLNTSLTNAGTAAKNIGTTGARNVENAGKSLEGASRNAESFNTGLGNVLVTMAKFRLVSAAINLVAGAFKSAFDEMKNVDTELVNIRKVTGFSKAEIDGLTKSAYSLATAYGRGASEVLKASTVFARAGYTSQIEQLSELSLLLQNVGDLNAEDASKFIIATDKAYKLGGSYEELTKVIDGLDNITNRNATDMQKMTEGMTVAGSVFAESGESIETYAALLGTATANTQRSGAEVARGLRTILMNLRQIRGETEDGELIDGESIAQAATALKEYAGISTMENGQLRKASDVLAELAAKWDTLSETQKAAISEAVAGKRQANILMTLMGDWGSVEKMMQEYETGAGTAAKENAIYMESWAAKTEQVSAAWNELIATLIETDTIKGALDLATALIQGITSFVNSPFMQKFMEIYSIPFDALAFEVEEFWKTFDLSGKYVNQAQKNANAMAESAKSLLESYNTDFGDGSRYQALLKNAENLTEEERVELGLLELQRQEREKELELAKEAAEEAAKRVEIEKKQLEANRNLNATTNGGMWALTQANNKFIGSGDVEKYMEDVGKALEKGSEFYYQLLAIRNSGGELYEQEERFVEAYELALRTYTEGGNSIEMLGKLQAATAYATGDSWEKAAEKGNAVMEEFTKYLKEGEYDYKVPVMVIGADTAQETIDEIRSNAEKGAVMVVSIAPGTNNGISSRALSLLPQHASGTSGAPGGPSIVNEKGPELIAANGLAWIAGGGKPTITMLPRGATVLTASQTKNAFGGSIPAFEGGTGNGLYNPLTGEELANQKIDHEENEYPHGRTVKVVGEAVWGTDEDGNPVYQRGPTKYTRTTKIYDPLTGKNVVTGSGGANYYGGAVDNTPDFQALESDLTKLLKNLDAQAKLAENEEDYLKAMMVYGEAQSAIADLLEQYRANGYADDSDEVLRLANLGYDYAAKQLGGYDKLQQNLIDALNALTQSTDDANALAEKREAVEKAREALANAESQRTVRVFNPATGQWEWVANASDIAKAQENLKNAEDALRKEELSQAVNAIKNAKPEDLGNMTLSSAIMEALFGGTPEQQTAFLNALGAASGGANWLASSEAQTAWNQGNNIGTQYNLNGITLTEAQASGMTIKELIAMLQGLKIM